MSVRRKTIEYAAAAIAVSAAIIAASVLYMGLPVATLPTSSAQGGGTSALAIRLTDPPQVPQLTSSLNLTYTSLSLLVGEPTGTQGQFSTKTEAVTPSGGSATLDLLKLQNVSQTIALANLPSGSIVYSVTFAVSGIKIDVNNTISSVALASGSSFTVTVAQPSAHQANDYLLLQLNPVVVNTPSGYQLIPSAVGIMGHGASGEDFVGSQHQLTNGEASDLHSAHGNVTASIVALSVSNGATTVTVKVNNSADFPVELNAIGLHGNFTVVGSVCAAFGEGMGQGQDMSSDAGQSTASNNLHCAIPVHMNEVVFVPAAPSPQTTTSSSTTTGSATCSSGQMGLVDMMHSDSQYRGLTLNSGQCVLLTFTGELTFGGPSFVLVPSTSPGQNYVLHVIGSNGANQQVMCTLPLGSGSCKLVSPQPDSADW